MLVLFFPGKDRQVGKTAEPWGMSQCTPATPPGQEGATAKQKWAESWNTLLPSHSDLSSGLEQTSLYLGCCLPKMDRSLDKSYLADRALDDAPNAFLKLFSRYSLIVSYVSKTGKSQLNGFLFCSQSFSLTGSSPIVARSQILIVARSQILPKKVHWCKNMSFLPFLGNIFLKVDFKKACLRFI